MIRHSDIKQRFGIIGNSPKLDHAIEVALQVSPTDISVLFTGESGTGKEAMPKIIHQNSQRKHGPYVAVNCGAIPEGTIDSELFGHEKGAFTGANDSRKGYFEVANGGTIFLDEVGELPLNTQVRLLRVLENGEFMKVGSSEVQKTDVRVVAATNVDLEKAISKGKFREDLYYRLNSIHIQIPPLRERREDTHLLFRKFAADFADKYQIPPIRLEEEAVTLLMEHPWPGNIRQLKNTAEQISAVEQNRSISAQTLTQYLPPVKSQVPALYKDEQQEQDFSEREILYKVLFDMKHDLNELKKVTAELMQGRAAAANNTESFLPEILPSEEEQTLLLPHQEEAKEEKEAVIMTLQDHEKILIQESLIRNQGRRKDAADELGISERTLYRKIKEYNL
jgi:DNA-binding NtrC family response regulator